MVKTTKPGPTLLVLNARSFVKPDPTSGLSTDLSSNKIDICIVSEIWLNSRVSSYLVCPDGYSILRKDRGNQRTGGVALIFRDDWKIKRLEFENIYHVISNHLWGVSWGVHLSCNKQPLMGCLNTKSSTCSGKLPQCQQGKHHRPSYQHLKS